MTKKKINLRKERRMHMEPLEILSLAIMVIGFVIVYMSKAIVKKYNLAEKQTCEHEAEMTEEEIKDYKYNKAVFNIKILGLIVSIPGLVLFIIYFR
jgi:hypothetical protein